MHIAENACACKRTCMYINSTCIMRVFKMPSCTSICMHMLKMWVNDIMHASVNVCLVCMCMHVQVRSIYMCICLCVCVCINLLCVFMGSHMNTSLPVYKHKYMRAGIYVQASILFHSRAT
jgi:hypothetical protein